MRNLSGGQYTAKHSPNLTRNELLFNLKFEVPRPDNKWQWFPTVEILDATSKIRKDRLQNVRNYLRFWILRSHFSIRKRFLLFGSSSSYCYHLSISICFHPSEMEFVLNICHTPTENHGGRLLFFVF